jgi:mannose-1-phosphate guanylyltransferase
MYSPIQSRRRAALILAGGDGVRLRELTRFITGHEVPKQFCAVTGDKTLLEETLQRVAMVVREANTTTIVNLQHRRFYDPLVSEIPGARIVEQPRNCGTAAAILHGLCRLDHLGPDSIVSIFPSDHFVDDDSRFMNHVQNAIEVVERSPAATVVLGIQPTAADPSYGWIEPSEFATAGSRLAPVRRFWEKPPTDLAAKLWRAGCLWNSFVLVGRSSQLRMMIARHAPRLYDSFDSAIRAARPHMEMAALEELYSTRCLLWVFLKKFSYTARPG